MMLLFVTQLVPLKVYNIHVYSLQSFISTDIEQLKFSTNPTVVHFWTYRPATHRRVRSPKPYRKLVSIFSLFYK